MIFKNKKKLFLTGKILLALLVVYCGVSVMAVSAHTGAQYYKAGNETGAEHANEAGLCHFWYSCPFYRSEFKEEHPVRFWSFGDEMPEGTDLGIFMKKDRGVFCPFCLWNCFFQPRTGRG